MTASSNKLKYIWQYCYDFEINKTYCVNLKSHLYTIPWEVKNNLVSRLCFSLIGLQYSNYREIENKPPKACDLSRDYNYFKDYQLTEDKIWPSPFYMFSQNNILSGISDCMDYYNKFIFFDQPAKEMEKYALSYCNKNLKSSHYKDCYYTSVNQFSLLCSVGLKPKMRIGAFIPTQEMHSWVELESKPIFDDIEETKHFYPMIELFT